MVALVNAAIRRNGANYCLSARTQTKPKEIDTDSRKFFSRCQFMRSWITSLCWSMARAATAINPRNLLETLPPVIRFQEGDLNLDLDVRELRHLK